MRRWYQSIALSFIVFSALFGRAWSAEILVEPATVTRPALVFVFGDFALGDDAAFVRSVLPLNEAVVVFQSAGGNVVAAIEIGRAIRLKQFATFVPKDGLCASACAIAWLGGTKKLMSSSAKIGFHAAYRESANSRQESGVANALVGAYLNQLGLSQTAVAYITLSGPDQMTWLTANDAAQLGIDLQVLDETFDKPNNGLNRLADTDLYGLDLMGMPIRSISLENCESQCDGRTDCLAFTYNVRNRACFLKSGASLAVGYAGAVSGYKAVLKDNLHTTEITVLERTDLPGNDYNTLIGSYPDCIAACDSQKRCKAFTYVPKGRKCWLKSATGKQVGNKGSISGVKLGRP